MNYRIRPLAALVLAMMLVSAADATTVRAPSAPPAKTQGIEPDEIDARARAAEPTTSSPARAAPARKPPVGTVPTPGKFVVAKDDNGVEQAYDTADCSTETKTITCCTNSGGASCNLFILLCEENGGTGKGDGGDAICVE
jgi:hypothetical protein